MTNKINIDALAATIAKEMELFHKDADGEIEVLCAKVGKQAVKTLKATSPKGTGKRRGKYARGWRTENTGNGKHFHGATIHNATDWQLTHLLENGHDLPQGGRSKALPHIEKVEQEAIKGLEEGLNKGGGFSGT